MPSYRDEANVFSSYVIWIVLIVFFFFFKYYDRLALSDVGQGVYAFQDLLETWMLVNLSFQYRMSNK